VVGWRWHLEQQRKLELDALIELITMTIAPDAWDVPLPPLEGLPNKLPDRGEPLPLVEVPTAKGWENIVRKHRATRP
jgi:hypothetical protein